MEEFKTLGRYEIIRQLGRGGMGVVLLARDPKIDRLVALKVIHHSNFTDPEHEEESIKRFHQEARAAGKLNHPNIVTVYDVGDQDEVSYIAMEFVEGRDLSTIIRERVKIPYHEATDIIVQVALALSYSHEHGIIHRDIKPGNIMIDKAGVVKITDFGLARLQDAESITKAGHTVGSPLYMSPEQIQSGDIDHRSDIFSMGVVLYETLTGARPFEGQSMSEVITKIIEQEPPSPTTVDHALPPRVNMILGKMLAKSPRDRYQTAGAVANDLKNLLALPDPFKSMTESDAQLTTHYPGELTPLAPFKRKVLPKPATTKSLLTAVMLGALFGLAGIFLLGGKSDRALMAKDALNGVLARIGETFTRKPQAPPPAPPIPVEPPRAKPGRLSLRCNVEGTVFVGGMEAGKTPLSGYLIPQGDNRLEIRANGYQPWIRDVTVAEGGTLDFEAALTLAQGSLRIVSDPPGAVALVDGISKGLTPVVVTGLATGSHSARVEMEGHIPWAHEAILPEGKGEEVFATLTKGFTLTVAAPAGAQVKIDGKEIGRGNVTALVTPGRHVVEISMAGSKTRVENVDAVAGGSSELQAPLEPAGFGGIKATATPWAEIYIGGVKSGTTPKTFPKIPAGAVEVKLVNPGYKPYIVKVSVEAGKQVRVSHMFTADEAVAPRR